MKGNSHPVYRPSPRWEGPGHPFVGPWHHETSILYCSPALAISNPPTVCLSSACLPQPSSWCGNTLWVLLQCPCWHWPRACSHCVPPVEVTMLSDLQWGLSNHGILHLLILSGLLRRGYWKLTQDWVACDQVQSSHFHWAIPFIFEDKNLLFEGKCQEDSLISTSVCHYHNNDIEQVRNITYGVESQIGSNVNSPKLRPWHEAFKASQSLFFWSVKSSL